MALRRKKQKDEPEKDQPDKPWTREDFLRDLRRVAKLGQDKQRPAK